MMPLRFLPLLLLLAAAPATRQGALPERAFACPETLPDDEARIMAVRDHVQRYRAQHPGATIARSLRARNRLLTKRRCQAETLQHTFPEQ